MAVAGRRHGVGIGRRRRRRRDARVGRELTAATATAGRGRPARPAADTAAAATAAADVFVFAGRRERVVDVRHEPRQRTTGHGPFRRGGRRVRERARRQAFGEFRALQFDVRRGHAVRGPAKLVERETTSDESRRFFPVANRRENKKKKKMSTLRV